MEVTIIDYKVGNYFSLINALEYCGAKIKVSNNYNEIKKSEIIILPGVGSFKTGMKNLNDFDLINVIKEHAYNKKKLLGICLGMQLFFDESEEFGYKKGLGLIPGKIQKLPEKDQNGKNNLIPNISWNTINKVLENDKKGFVNNLNDESFFYFVHSYFAIPKEKNNILAYSNFFNFQFTSIVNFENIYGTQFHLEKSGEHGIQLLKNFLKL